MTVNPLSPAPPGSSPPVTAGTGSSSSSTTVTTPSSRRLAGHLAAEQGRRAALEDASMYFLRNAAKRDMARAGLESCTSSASHAVPFWPLNGLLLHLLPSFFPPSVLPVVSLSQKDEERQENHEIDVAVGEPDSPRED